MQIFKKSLLKLALFLIVTVKPRTNLSREELYVEMEIFIYCENPIRVDSSPIYVTIRDNFRFKK